MSQTIHTNYGYPNYTLRKKFLRLLGSAFYIYGPDQQTVLFYVEQKPFKLREEIDVYSGEDKSELMLQIRARNIMDFSGLYEVIDPTLNQKVGLGEPCGNYHRGFLRARASAQAGAQPHSANVYRGVERPSCCYFQTEFHDTLPKDLLGFLGRP